MVTVSWSELRREPVYEDDHLLVLNKVAGVSVMGDRHADSLVDLASAIEPVHWVHRIDKVTSGLLLLAKTFSVHSSLTRQFADRTADKRYLAWVEGTQFPEYGSIDLPLRPGRKQTIRVAGERSKISYGADDRRFTLPDEAVDRSKKSYESRTDFATACVGEDHTLLVLKPVTGRRHQIRVHLAWLGFPIAGDPLFHGDQEEQRTYLHSWGCEITCYWRDESRTQFWARPSDDFLHAFSGDNELRLTDALKRLAEVSD